MAYNESNRKSNKKSKGKQGKNAKGQRTSPATVNKDNTNTRDGFNTIKAKGEGMERMPSNAPTMAIAPSDYEHIFHEATGVVAGQQVTTPPPAQHHNTPSPSPPSPSPNNSPPQPVPQVVPPTVPTLPPPPMPRLAARGPAEQTMPGYQQQQLPLLQAQQTNYAPHLAPRQMDLVVTPDGYSILGQSNNADGHHPRQVQPPHIVRASNQFSRAVLARVARYLASRAEPQNR